MQFLRHFQDNLLDRRSSKWDALKVGDSAPTVFSFLRHLARRFWNQTWTNEMVNSIEIKSHQIGF